MKKEEIGSRFFRNMMLSDLANECEITAIMIDNNKIYTGFDYTITRSNSENGYEFCHVRGIKTSNRITHTDGIPGKFSLTTESSWGNTKLETDIKCEIIPLGHKEGNATAKYTYFSKYSTETDNATEYVELRGKGSILNYLDDSIQSRLIIIVIPYSKSVPIIYDSCDLLKEYSPVELHEYMFDLFSNEKFDKLLNTMSSESRVFNSYTEPFDLENYTITKPNKMNKLKNTRLIDKVKELDYLLYDNIKEEDDIVTYNNPKTGMSSVVTNNNLDDNGNIETTIINKFLGIEINKEIHRPCYNYVKRGGEDSYFINGKLEKHIEFRDYGYSLNGNPAHMRRITSDEDDILSTDLLDNIINRSQFIDDLRKIDYKNEYPIATYIAEGDVTTKFSYPEVSYDKFYPYAWLDKDHKVVEFYGRILTRDDDHQVDEILISTTVIDEKVMIESFSYIEGTHSSLVTKFYNLEGNVYPAFMYTQETDMSLYGTSIITTVENIEDTNNPICRITKRNSTDMTGKKVAEYYSYESKELSIMVDTIRNKIESFVSSIYNKSDEFVYVRNMYGCLEKMYIKNLKK